MYVKSFTIFLPLTLVALCMIGGVSTLGESETKENCAPYFQGNTKVPCWALENKCYCFTTDKMHSWAEADTFCRTGNMTLLSLETEEEERLIYSHWQVTQELADQRYWTSGKFPQKGYNRTYEWASTEPFQPFTYVNWQSGKPSHNDFGYCVYFWMDFDFESGYYWVDYSCSALYIDHICESV